LLFCFPSSCLSFFCLSFFCLFAFHPMLTLCLLTILQAENVTLNLPIVRHQGMMRIEGALVVRKALYEQAGEGFLIEAELASSLIGKKVSQLEKHEGTASLADPPNLSFELRVNKSGTYNLLLRMRKNTKTWKHRNAQLNVRRGDKRSPEIASVRIGGKALALNFLTPFDVGNEWVWQKAAVVSMKKGRQSLSLGELPGFHLDKIILKPGQGGELLGLEDEEDDEIDEEDVFEDIKPSRQLPMESASIETAEISPLSVAEWAALKIEAEDNGAKRKVSASTDGGKNWLSVPDSASLAAIKTNSNGRDQLRIRIEWMAGKSTNAARLKQVSLIYRPGAADAITLAGPYMVLRADRKTGAIHEIVDPGGERLGIPLRRNLFSIQWRPQKGGQRQLNADAFQFKGVEKTRLLGMNEYVFSYRHLEARLDVSCRILISIPQLYEPFYEGDLWNWKITVTNQGEGLVHQVRFPAFDGLLFASQAFRPASLWSVRGDVGIFPGNMSMGWMLAHDGKSRGLYLASLDKTLTASGFEHRREGPLAHTAIISYGVVEPGKTREYAFATALASNDWHWAADHYRRWAYNWMKRPQWSASAKRMDGWWNIMTDTEAALLDRRSTTIFEDARWFGLRHIQSWVGSGDASFIGRMPYLSPRLGTPEMSKKDSERIRSLGGHIGHYIQAREWDASYADAELIGYVPRKFFPESFTVPSRAWSKEHTIHGAGDHQIMCPSSGGWQDHIASNAAQRVSLFGNDTAYFDQMGCTTMSCERKHDHGLEHHVSGKGYTQMADKILTAMRAKLSETTISNEGANAATGQFVHYHLISCLPYLGFKNEFLYTFPDLALVNGTSNGAASYGVPPRQHLRSLYLMHRFELPAWDQYARDVILLRQRIHDWQYDGRFMDDVGLTTTAKGERSRWPADGFKPRTGVIAKWFLYAKDGTKGVLINFINEEKIEDSLLKLERRSVALALRDKSKQSRFTPSGQAFAFFDDGSVNPMNYKVEKDFLTFNCPSRKVGSILIPVKVTERDALRHFAFQTTSGPDRLVLGAVNISDASVNAEWSAEVPDGFLLKTTGGKLALEPHSTKQIAIPLNLSSARAMADARITWKHSNVESSSTALLSPALRNGDMELDVDENGSPDSWWNFSGSFCHILHRWVHDVDLHSLAAVYDTENKRTGRASIRLRGPLPYTYTITSKCGTSAGTKKTLPISASQHLYAKPNTAYRITAWAFTKDVSARCSLSAGGKSASAMPHNEWQQLSVQFKTPVIVKRVIVTLANGSRKDLPVWFDDVAVEEIDQ
jgi:hypothetical protein